MDSDNDIEVDDNIQYFARKKNNSGLHKYESNSFENKKSNPLICVNGTGEGEGSSDVLYKVNIDVDRSTVRKIEKNTNSGKIVDEDSDSFSDNYEEFVRMSSIETKKLLNNVQHLQQQMVSFDEEVNINKRPVELISFNTYPTEEKEEDVSPKTATATAVGRREGNSVTPSSAVQDVLNTDSAKDEIMPVYMPMPIPMPMKCHDGNPRDQIIRMREDRLKCIQPVSVNASGSGSGSHWNLKQNYMMSLLSPSNVSKSTLSASASASASVSGCKQSSFPASSGWTLKKQFKNVFSSQSVSSTSPTTGNFCSGQSNIFDVLIRRFSHFIPTNFISFCFIFINDSSCQAFIQKQPPILTAIVILKSPCHLTKQRSILFILNQIILVLVEFFFRTHQVTAAGT